jgi:hypothetical protein
MVMILLPINFLVYIVYISKEHTFSASRALSLDVSDALRRHKVGLLISSGQFLLLYPKLGSTCESRKSSVTG